MNRLTWLIVAVAAVVPQPTESPTTQAARPNIVVIVTDDMGYADLGFQGSKDIPTPNIDALAAGGIRFTDAYVSGPYCSPTRAGLMTGRYPQRFGHEFNISMTEAHQDAGLPLGEVTMADRLKAAGYRTALFGKWHLGFAPAFRPTRRGFDEFYGFLAGAHTYLGAGGAANPIYDGDSIARDVPYLTEAFAQHAVDFIRRPSTQPFFLYLAFNAVHVPLQATDQYLARVANIAEPQRRAYAALLVALDDAVGRTLAALRDAHLEENTLVFYFNDNGGPQQPGAWNGSNNAPLRGGKTETWEGGIRVPFVIRWKGHLPEGRTDTRPIIQLDVLPTALAAAGVAARPEWKLDGVNLLPYLTGDQRPPHEALYWRLGTRLAIRKGDWKLVKVTPRGAEEYPDTVPDISGASLFNLRTDMSEEHDLAAAHPDRVRELSAAWLAWNRQLKRPGWPPPVARGRNQ